MYNEIRNLLPNLEVNQYQGTIYIVPKQHELELFNEVDELLYSKLEVELEAVQVEKNEQVTGTKAGFYSTGRKVTHWIVNY